MITLLRQNVVAKYKRQLSICLRQSYLRLNVNVLVILRQSIASKYKRQMVCFSYVKPRYPCSNGKHVDSL